MDAAYQRPGVYIEELPGLQVIQGVATNIAAFVGVTAQLPTQGMSNGPEAMLVTSWNDYTRQFGSFAWNCFLPYAVYSFFAEGGSICYVVPVQQVTTTAGKVATATMGSVTINAASPGDWANNLGILISDAGVTVPASGSDGGNTQPAPLFNMQVVYTPPKQTTGGGAAGKLSVGEMLIQAFIKNNGITLVQGDKQQYYVLEQYSSLSASSFTPQALATRVNSRSLFIRVAPAAASAAGAKSGSDSSARPANGLKGFTAGTVAEYDYSKALNALLTVPNVSLLAMPDSVTIMDPATSGNSTGGSQYSKQQAAINSGLAYCEAQTNLFFVADPPCGLATADILSFRQQGNAFNSSFGALYYPWISVLDPLSGNIVVIPPSGAVLGRYSATDLRVGVYKAPAGTQDGKLNLAYGVNSQVTDADQDLLNPAGVNAIRMLYSYGICVWGARTLSHDTEWQYVNVRRLFIFVEQSVKQGLQWVVFEPNGPRLWNAVTRDIGAFLKSLWQQGALYGNSADDAFFVTCDDSNNPIEQQELGYLNITVGIRPMYPAEFVIIQFSQKTMQSS